MEVAIFSCKNRLKILFQSPKVHSSQALVPSGQVYETSERHDMSRGNAAQSLGRDTGEELEL